MNWLQTLSGIAFVFGLLFLLYWASLRFNRARWSGRRPTRMKVVEKLALGDKRSLLLVQVGEENFLVGSTPQNISLLSSVKPSVDSEVVEGPLPDPVAPATGPSFRHVLEMFR